MINFIKNITPYSVIEYLTQLIYFRHNAKVLADFEYRTGMITYMATNGTLSKPYYSLEALKPVIEDAFTQEYNNGYRDALEDHGIKVEGINV